MSFQIEFEPTGARGVAAEGRTLLETARQLGVDFGPLCRGNGKCGRCRVRVVAGAASPPTAVERQKIGASELEDGYRLACQAYARSDLRIDLSAASSRASERQRARSLPPQFPRVEQEGIASERVPSPVASDGHQLDHPLDRGHGHGDEHRREHRHGHKHGHKHGHGHHHSPWSRFYRGLRKGHGEHGRHH